MLKSSNTVPSVLDETFSPQKDINPAERFGDMIGVSNPDEGRGKQEIILSFDREQGHYFKSLPWHRSYRIITDNDDEFRVRLCIIPNYELFQRILMHSDTVEVIEPGWLRERVRNTLSESLKKYA